MLSMKFKDAACQINQKVRYVNSVKAFCHIILKIRSSKACGEWR